MGEIKFTPEVRAKILNHIHCGVHPKIACKALGMKYETVVSGKNHGEPLMVEFHAEIERVLAGGECVDVLSTARAARVSKTKVNCPHCHLEFSADTAALARINSAVQEQQVLEGRAKIALSRLERRFSLRWSPRVTHTVEDQLNGFLNVAQRVLDEEVFISLCEAYEASRAGEGETGDGESEPSTGGVH